MNDTVLIQATQGVTRKVTVTTTREEVGNANIRLACSALRDGHNICVFAHERFVTDGERVWLSNDDLVRVKLLARDPVIAALIDAGNAILYGAPLRPLAGIASHMSDVNPALRGEAADD